MQPLIGQTDSSGITQLEFLKASAQYRSEIIGQIKSTLTNFNLLVDSLKAISDFPDAHEKVRQKFTTKTTAWLAESENRNYFFMHGIGTAVDYKDYRTYTKWLKANADYFWEYLILAGQDFIEPAPPYKLSNKNLMWEDFKFYQIQDDMTLVDIGTGFGHFPFIVAFTGFKGRMIMTEIDDDLIVFLQKKMETFDLSGINCQLEVIKGDKTNPGLHAIKADKIFMRETFHHIKSKKEMLEGLKSNLKEDGYIYVIENVRDFVPDMKDVCKKIIYKSEIISSFLQAGYQLVEESNQGQNVMLKFSL